DTIVLKPFSFISKRPLVLKPSGQKSHIEREQKHSASFKNLLGHPHFWIMVSVIFLDWATKLYFSSTLNVNDMTWRNYPVVGLPRYVFLLPLIILIFWFKVLTGELGFQLDFHLVGGINRIICVC